MTSKLEERARQLAEQWVHESVADGLTQGITQLARDFASDALRQAVDIRGLDPRMDGTSTWIFEQYKGRQLVRKVFEPSERGPADYEMALDMVIEAALAAAEGSGT